MQGSTMSEFCEFISHGREAEFDYDDTTYVLQPEIDNGKAYLVIWDCTPDHGKCIAKREIPEHGDIPQGIIDAILSEKCFDGRSFMEIEQDVNVTVIF